jgi:hypothetical protein
MTYQSIFFFRFVTTTCFGRMEHHQVVYKQISEKRIALLNYKANLIYFYNEKCRDKFRVQGGTI